MLTRHTFRLFFVLAFLITTLSSLQAKRLIEIEKEYSNSSVNIIVSRNNSLIVHNNFQLVFYYDAVGYALINKRELNIYKWDYHHAQYKGCTDSHKHDY